MAAAAAVAVAMAAAVEAMAAAAETMAEAIRGFTVVAAVVVSSALLAIYR